MNLSVLELATTSHWYCEGCERVTQLREDAAAGIVAPLAARPIEFREPVFKPAIARAPDANAKESAAMNAREQKAFTAGRLAALDGIVTCPYRSDAQRAALARGSQPDPRRPPRRRTREHVGVVIRFEGVGRELD